MDKKQFDFISNVSTCVKFYGRNIPSDVCNFIGCQFALESFYGTSSSAKVNSNYCGMKNPLVRISSSIYSGDSNYLWAVYPSLGSCVVDFLLCLQFHRPVSCDYDTISHYCGFISKFYCPEKDYIDKINRIYQSFKSYQNGN